MQDQSRTLPVEQTKFQAPAVGYAVFRVIGLLMGVAGTLLMAIGVFFKLK